MSATKKNKTTSKPMAKTAPKAPSKQAELPFTQNDGSREDVLDDLQKVYMEHGKLTRSLHETHGRYGEHMVKKHFGGYNAAKHVLGIEDVNLKKLYRIRSNREIAEATIKEMDEEREKLYHAYSPPPIGRSTSLLIASDMHDFACDKLYYRSFVGAAELMQPDIVVLNGDIFDCYELSTFEKEAKHKMLPESIKWGHEFFGALRKASPKTQIDFIAGNHEDRLLKRLNEVSDIRDVMHETLGLTISKIFKLDDFGIQYVGKNSLAVPDRKHYSKHIEERNYMIYNDCFLVDHHPSGMQMRMPGVNGHHHKFTSTAQYSYDYGSYDWVQSGAGHVRKASYCDGKKWDNSFISVFINNEKNISTWHNHPVKDECMVHGKRFIRTKDEEVS